MILQQLIDFEKICRIPNKYNVYITNNYIFPLALLPLIIPLWANCCWCERVNVCLNPLRQWTTLATEFALLGPHVPS